MIYYENDIESVEITWKDGYKRITVYLKNGDNYTVESDN
jgi:L-rhamnose isomerase